MMTANPNFYEWWTQPITYTPYEESNMTYQLPNLAVEQLVVQSIEKQLVELQLKYEFVKKDLEDWERTAKAYGFPTPYSLKEYLELEIDDGK